MDILDLQLLCEFVMKEQESPRSQMHQIFKRHHYQTTSAKDGRREFEVVFFIIQTGGPQKAKKEEVTFDATKKNPQAASTTSPFFSARLGMSYITFF